jgi:hypothetical protein
MRSLLLSLCACSLLLAAGSKQSNSMNELLLRELLRWQTAEGSIALAQEAEALSPEQRQDEQLRLTAGVVLALQACGYDHRTPNRYRRAAQSAVDWLLTQRDSANAFSPHLATQALVSCSLLEAYALTEDPILKPLALDLVEQLTDQQLVDGADAGAWPAQRGGGHADDEATHFAVLAMKSALAAGLPCELFQTRRWVEAQLADPALFEDASRAARVMVMAAMCGIKKHQTIDDLILARMEGLGDWALALDGQTRWNWALAMLCFAEGPQWRIWDEAVRAQLPIVWSDPQLDSQRALSTAWQDIITLGIFPRWRRIQR